MARRLHWATDQNDPIVLLESDHRRFEKLLERGEATTERGAKRRSELLNTLTAALNVHEAIEEKILYPALKPHAEAHDIVLEGYQEHHVADLIIRELHKLARSDENWGAKRRADHPRSLNELGARMKALKAEFEKRWRREMLRSFLLTW